MELITLEILRIAKDLVVNEYINMRAQAHNRWLLDSTVLWNTRRIKLPYPDIPPYPNENEILERARKLMDFINTPNAPSPIIESLTFSESNSNIKQLDQNYTNEKIIDSENSKNINQTRSYTIEDLVKKIENSKEELILEREEKQETSSNIETKEELILEREEKKEEKEKIDSKEFSESNMQQPIINQTTETTETTETIKNQENNKEEEPDQKNEISENILDNTENKVIVEDNSNQPNDQKDTIDNSIINQTEETKEDNKEITKNDIFKSDEEYQLKIDETKKELEEYMKNKDKLEKDEHTMTNGKILSALLRKIEELRKRMSED